MRKVAFLLLWLYVFTIPWENSTNYGDGIGSATRIMGLVSMLGGITAVVIAGSVRRIVLFHIFLALLQSLIVASFFWSVDPEATVKTIRTFINVIWVVWLLWEFAPDESSQRWIMLAYITGSYVSAFNTFLEMHRGTFHKSMERVTAIGWNPNGLAVVLALGIPMACYLGLDSQSLRWVRALVLPYLIVAPVAIALNASRGGSIAAIFALSALPLMLFRKGIGVKVMTVALAIAAVGVATAVVPDAAWQRLSTTSTEASRGNLNGRTKVWAAGVRAIEENPLVGVGSGAFERAASVNYTAHNSFISIFAELGLIGFLIFASLIVLCLCALWQMDPAASRLWWPMMLCLLTASCVGTWEARRPTWLVLGLLIAQAFSKIKNSGSEGSGEPLHEAGLPEAEDGQAQ
jgi:O-antigen ligase